MEYGKMFEDLQDGAGNVYKPTLGVHKVQILEEPIETEYVDGDKVTPQICLKVLVNDENKTWYISKGTTINAQVRSDLPRVYFRWEILSFYKEEARTS